MGRLLRMRRTIDPTDLAAEASAAAAARAGVEIRPLHTLEGLKTVSGLFAEVWGTAEDDAHLPLDVLRAQVHAGNYAAGAFDDGEMVGGLAGFFGRDADGLYLHSHILGVTEKRRGGSIGFALKQHQRAWALDAGLDRVTWTTDPLVRRNAYFNLHKLGASASAYLENFYGRMSDGINAGDESDRLLIDWRLEDARVTRAASGRSAEPDIAELESSGAVVLLSADGDVNDAAAGAAVVLCSTPEDVVALRRSDPATAARWRMSLRATLGASLDDGYVVTGFTRSGWYVLSRNGSNAGS
jgi:predicted GNAT superfamily acetyltransferase